MKKRTMMKVYFMAAQMKTDDGKYYAYVLSFINTDNLIGVIQRHKNLINAIMCKSRPQAEELVNKWNADYKIKGVYLFD